MMRSKLIVAICIATALSTALAADLTPQPRGVYPLAQGIYVAQGSVCATPANAAIRVYDGKGISTAHTHACVASVLSQQQGRYTVNQTCIDSGEGEGKSFEQKQEVVVIDGQTFAQDTGASNINYHYCPATSLPPDLQRFARHADAAKP